MKELFQHFRPVHLSNSNNPRADKFTYAGQNGCKERFENMGCFRYQQHCGVSVSLATHHVTNNITPIMINYTAAIF
jgi:hypothetical protein